MITAVIVGLMIILSTKLRRMLLSRLIFDFVNRTEAKLARLYCDSRSIDGLEVFYHSNTKHFSSDKPVLVLIHGFSADKYVWNRFAKRFSSQYHLVIPDLKGHGQTAYHPDDDYSVPSQCQMLLALLDQLNIKFLKIKIDFQKNIKIGKYILNLNTRNISSNEKSLALTEKETAIISFLNKSKKAIKIEELQSEVWGHKSKLETHTVETHVYRLRKKILKQFKDNNFIVSSKKGYFIF